jgi:hypothetical protein
MDRFINPKNLRLYLKLLHEESDPLLWKSEELQSPDTLKQALIMLQSYLCPL